MSEPVPPVKSVVIGTAGHIDHGKTALVRALTGADTDRLPEEKRRGITIDLGFASLALPAGGHGAPLALSFVDVPGHHAFVRNMLAGAGGIDCVMLVISAEEGIKPQTEEHLAICSLLGITRGLTVLSKADAVSDERLQQVYAQVAHWLESSPLAEAAILPVSALTGQGIAELKTALASLAAQIPGRSADAVPRLPLDRAFTMRGFGTVVTGTLQAGVIQPGQTLSLEPGRRTVRVRGIQVHGREAPEGRAASRVALNLAGIEVAQVRRGDTLVPAGSHPGSVSGAPSLSAVDTLDVEITLLPGAAPIKHRARVRFHAFTSDTLAAVSLYDYQPISSGTPRYARLRLAHPVLVVPGDRFVLRQCSPAFTLGGGRVLDVHPLPKLKKAQALAWLRQIAHASPEQQLSLRVARRGASGISLGGLIAETGLTAAAIRARLAPLLATELAAAPDGHLLTRAALHSASELIVSSVGASIGASGAASVARGGGVKRAELRTQTRLGEQVFDFALERLLQAKKLACNGDILTLYGVAPRLPDADVKHLAALEYAYAAGGLNPPLLSDVAVRLRLQNADLRRLMTLLLREGKLVKLGNPRLGSDDLYMHRDALAGLRAQMRSLRGQSLDVSRFKQITGLSRKVAIPLLEHLDREHVTRRQGETRLVL